MANTIKLRRSATPGAVPTTSQIALGELGVNHADGLLFLKRSTSGNETGAGTSIVQLFPATGGAITGDVTLNAQSDLRFADSDSSNYVALQAPATLAADNTYTLPTGYPASNGQVLSSTTGGTMSWVAAGSGSGQVYTYSSSAPGSPAAGDEWLDSDTGILYTYVNDGNTSAWVELSATGGVTTSNLVIADYGLLTEAVNSSVDYGALV